MNETNYSFETSHPAYTENPVGKQVQQERIFAIVKSRDPNGITLKELEELTGLPQSTVAGRVNDCIEAKQIMYSGTVQYKDRKRKKIVLYVEPEKTQSELDFLNSSESMYEGGK